MYLWIIIAFHHRARRCIVSEGLKKAFNYCSESGRIKQGQSYSPLSCQARTHRSCHREEPVIADQHDVEDRGGAEQVINHQPEFAEASPEDPSPRQHIGHVQGNAEGTCNRRGPFTPQLGRPRGPGATSQGPRGRSAAAAGSARPGLQGGRPGCRGVPGGEAGSPGGAGWDGARVPARPVPSPSCSRARRGGAALYPLGNPRWPG